MHAETLDALGIEPVAVASRTPGARAEFRRRHGIEHGFDGYEAMLAEAALDIAVVAVPNALHADCAVAALETDTHAVVEKPLAASLEGAERVAAAERESEATVMVGFMRAFEPAVEAAGDLAAEGHLGDVHAVDLEYVRRRGVPRIGSWFTDASLAGGGALIDVGVHMLHVGLSVLGFPDASSVTATTGAHFGSKDDYTYLEMWGGEPDPDGTFDVDDTARAFVRTADGTTLHLRCAWASNREPEHRVRVLGDEAGVTLRPGDRELTVTGTADGALSTETRTYPSRAADVSLAVDSADGFVGQWDYFLGVVAGAREHDRNTVEEGLAVQRLVDAIYESAATEASVAPAGPD
jgi:predicted dehydrogenase